LQSRLPFQLATFLGSALLFFVQPLLAKQILPWFGGGSAVWSACLLFFQLGLVAGYAYAHLTRRLGPARQATMHLTLLVVSIALLPVSPGAGWKPPDGDALVARVLWLLTANVGLPYILLAATAPLLQDWQAQLEPAPAEAAVVAPPPTDMTADGVAVVDPAPAPAAIAPARPEAPYRLYVLSNAGSLLALLAYPILVEPRLPLARQHLLWSATFAAFVAVCGWCTWLVRRRATAVVRPHAAAHDDRPTPLLDPILWVVLPAVASGLLLATTSTLTQDVAAIPLLWIAPLALYLVTFMLAFGGWYWRPLWAFVYINSLFLAMYAIRDSGGVPAVVQAIALVGACFAAAMVCHGELVQLRPPVRRLTSFYLAMAAGGALGGAFVALAAPLLFHSLVELPALHLVAVGLVSALAVRRVSGRTGALLRILTPAFIVGLVAVVGITTLASEPNASVQVRDIDRGFYGVVKVTEEPAANLRRLYHGRILHGLQHTDPALTTRVTTYYVEGSGVELAIRQHPRRLAGQPLRIGVVGLGTGTVAAWGQAGDQIHFFEIDPVVIGISQRNFTYIAESKAASTIVRGDARLSLERELAAPGGAHSYDVIVLDAFSGDAIPVHLLTDEAVGLYDQVLAADGILVVHVSNRYLDLRPIVRGLAARRGFETLEIFRDSDFTNRAAASTWMLVTRNRPFADAMRPSAVEPDDSPPVVWTDDFSSLLAVWRPR
jgi:spermidine synthase